MSKDTVMENELMTANVSTYSVPNSSYAAVSGYFFHGYKTIAGSLIFFLLFPFLLFNFKFFPIKSTTVAILGAVLMVVFDVVTQKEAYAVIGLPHNLKTILLLLGMMLIGEYVEREQIVARFLRRFLSPEIGFAGFLFRTGSLVFLVSALFTSEGAAVMIAPVLLRCWKEHERAHVELETLLVAVATTANIGGASTYFGSVMLALISSKTHDVPYQKSLVDLRLCLRYLVLPAVLCFWVNYALLLVHFWVRSRRLSVCHGSCDRRRSEREPFGIAGSDGGQSPGNGYLGNDQSEDFFYDSFVFREDRLVHPPTLETIIEDEVLELPEAAAWGSESDTLQIRGIDGGEENLVAESGDGNEVVLTTRLRSCSGSEDLTTLSAEDSDDIPVSQHSSPTNSIPSSNPALSSADAYGRHNEPTSMMSGTSAHCSHSVYSMAEFFGKRLRIFEQESQSSSVILMIVLTVVILTIPILLLASSTHVYFDPGFIPIAGAFALILVDSIVNRFAASFIVRRVDWSVIPVFSAVFVWMAGFNNTGVPRFVWEKLGFSHATFDEVSSTAVFTAVLLLTSNTFGQVPVTMMVLDQLKPGFNQKRLVLYLAWVISIAGNLTPYSSAATVFVSSHSSQVLNYPMTLWSFARFGVPSSLVLVTLGLSVISLLLMSS